MKKILPSILASFAALSFVLPAQAADVVGKAEAGAGKVAMCIGCHGIPNYHTAFPVVYHVPKISGQSASYLQAALKEYQEGKRKFASMQAIAAPLTEQDMADIAAYYSQQAPAKAPATVAAPSAEVKALLDKANCASCHGANFSTPLDGSMPKLAGQHPDYLYAALKAYAQPDESRIFGRSNAIMGGIVKGQFTLPQLRQIADYIGSLPGDVETVTESRFRK
jgi:cytochrome c553